MKELITRNNATSLTVTYLRDSYHGNFGKIDLVGWFNVNVISMKKDL